MRTGVVQFVLASISGFLVLCWAVPRAGRLLTSWLDAHSVALDVEAEVEYDSADEPVDEQPRSSERDDPVDHFAEWETECACRPRIAKYTAQLEGREAR